MHAPDWQSVTRSYDWDRVFNWSLFVVVLLFVLPADLYMRVVVAQTGSSLLWALLLPLPGYLLLFVAKHRRFILSLAILNGASFLFAVSKYYYGILLPLIVNIGSEGVFYTLVFQCLFFFGFVFHIVMIRNFWGVN